MIQHVDQQQSSIMRLLQAKLQQISELDNSIFRMVQLKRYILQFSCFDEADTENVTGQIHIAKAAADTIIGDIKTTHGEFAARWIGMHRMLSKREHALTEAQTNGILMADDPVYETLLQKQVQLMKLLEESEINLFL